MNGEGPSFPPLLRGEEAPRGVEPFAKAIASASQGVDAGLIVYKLTPELLEAAIVLAPETPLEDAMAMVFALQLGFGDALGALAPPEVGVHFAWPGGLRLNGAACGGLKAASSTNDPTAVPDWLVIGLELALHPGTDADPGRTPDKTTLIEEGCADVAPTRLLESWARHSLVWINRWSEDGMAPLHADWRSRAVGLGEPFTLELNGETHEGIFVGLDQQGGLLLRIGDETKLFPLTQMLE